MNGPVYIFSVVPSLLLYVLLKARYVNIPHGHLKIHLHPVLKHMRGIQEPWIDIM